MHTIEGARPHVPSRHVHDMPQDNLGRLRQARRSGDGWHTAGRSLHVCATRAAPELDQLTVSAFKVIATRFRTLVLEDGQRLGSSTL